MKWLIPLIILGFWTVPAFADYEAAARYSASLRGISLLVIVDGEVVFEDYPNGGAADRPHALASGTKSFVGLIAAAAVQDGLLDLDEPVSNTITEWQDTRRADITVRQLLNQTDGLARRGARLPSYAAAVRARYQYPAGTVFAYHSIPFQVFGELMRRKLDGSPVDYLTRRVFEPIGLEVGAWRRGRDGNPTMAAGARLTARDWARFGEFILARGRWNGEALVSPVVFEDLFQGSTVNPAYGLAWWLNDPIDPSYASATPPLSNQADFWMHPEVFPDDLVFAAGLGDQRLYISWERNMVVVRQAEGIAGAMLGRRLSWSDTEFWRLLEGGPSEAPRPRQRRRQQQQQQSAVPADPAPSQDLPTFELTPGMMMELSPSTSPEVEEEVETTPEEEESDEFVGPSY